MDECPVEIVVVGAGITGMAMALALARQGVEVTLLAAGALPEPWPDARATAARQH